MPCRRPPPNYGSTLRPHFATNFAPALSWGAPHDAIAPRAGGTLPLMTTTVPMSWQYDDGIVVIERARQTVIVHPDNNITPEPSQAEIQCGQDSVLVLVLVLASMSMLDAR